MAFNAYLKIDGIPGESTDSKHKDQIEIIKFAWAIDQPDTYSKSSHGALTAERANFASFKVIKATDKATPKLALACAAGQHIKNAKLELCRATSDQETYMVYELDDIIVKGFRPTGDAHADEAVPTEEVEFAYGKVTLTYTQYDKTGKSVGNVAANWNLMENRGS